MTGSNEGIAAFFGLREQPGARFQAQLGVGGQSRRGVIVNCAIRSSFIEYAQHLLPQLRDDLRFHRGSGQFSVAGNTTRSRRMQANW